MKKYLERLREAIYPYITAINKKYFMDFTNGNGGIYAEMLRRNCYSEAVKRPQKFLELHEISAAAIDIWYFRFVEFEIFARVFLKQSLSREQHK